MVGHVPVIDIIGAEVGNGSNVLEELRDDDWIGGESGALDD